MRVDDLEESIPGRQGLLVSLRTMAVAGAVAGLAAWVWIVQAVNADCDGWGCLGVYIVGIPILVISVFTVSWMGFRLVGTPLPALVIICAMTTVVLAMGLAEPQTHGSVWTAVAYTLASGYWAWAFVPGRDLRFAIAGLGLIAVIVIGHEVSTRFQLAHDERDDIEVTGIQPLLLDHEQWSIVSASSAYDGESLKLIYDEDGTEDALGSLRRLVIEIHDLPPDFAPGPDCYDSYPAHNDPPTLSCTPLEDDVWRVRYGGGTRYLARIETSAVTLDEIRASSLTDSEAREITGQLEPVSAGQFASAD